jgi:hypothetical protein
VVAVVEPVLDKALLQISPRIQIAVPLLLLHGFTTLALLLTKTYAKKIFIDLET